MFPFFIDSSITVKQSLNNLSHIETNFSLVNSNSNFFLFILFDNKKLKSILTLVFSFNNFFALSHLSRHFILLL